MYWLVKKMIKASSHRSKRKIINYILGTEIENYIFFKLKRYGLDPENIVDVGAYEGGWTKNIKTIFPSSKVLMVEALAKNEFLERVTDDFRGVSYCIELLGAKTGLEKTYYECETGSSYYEEKSNHDKTVTVRMTKSLDDVLLQEQFSLGHPSVLKIDAQGAELDILEGSKQSLPFFEFVYLETPIVEYNINAPDFETYIKYMSNIGYGVFDVSTHHINKDLLLQVDVLFLKRQSHMAKVFEKVLKK